MGNFNISWSLPANGVFSQIVDQAFADQAAAI
jgi:hypothetical protein